MYPPGLDDIDNVHLMFEFEQTYYGCSLNYSEYLSIIIGYLEMMAEEGDRGT